MRNVFLIVSCAAMLCTMTGCNGNSQQMPKTPMQEEREFIREAVRHRSPDVQKVEIIDNTVVYTHIFDGIIDIKTYTYDGDTCVEAERVYTFPNQMSALRHYRRAVEHAALYDNIELFNSQVRYDLKKEQYDLETKGLSKEQLKAKFDKQISDAKADMQKQDMKIKKDVDKMKKDMRGEHHKKHNAGNGKQ